jgi:hypothetical protein
MAKIDRLGWADGMSFNAFGVRFGVRVNDPRVLESLIERFPPGTQPSATRVVDHLYSVTGFPTDSNGRIRKFNLGYWNLFRFARSRNFDELLDTFESHLQLTVAEHAPRRIFVHAGVVGWNGRAILIPGLSFSGKTTLVDHLIRRGATYYSDEYAVLDQQGRVHPYPRALGLRSTRGQPATKMAAEEMGAQVGSKPLRIGLVLSTRFKAGSRWRPRELTRGKGVLELMSNAVAARSQPELALSVLPKALQSAKILKGVRGEASEIVESILVESEPPF